MTDGQWIKSPTARRVLEHWADARPAWLWSGDGAELLWRNGAARLFLAKIKKSGPKLLASPVPIKGQVPRLIRLGTTGRSSLSRIQFLAGDKPISATCAVTPLQLADGSNGLLIVAVDPIDSTLLPEATPDDVTRRWLPQGSQYLVLDRDQRVVAASPLASNLGDALATVEGGGSITLDGHLYVPGKYSAGPAGETLIVLERSEAPQAIVAPAVPVAEPEEPPAPEAELEAWAEADGPEELPDSAVDTRIDPEWAEVEAAARATLEAPEFAPVADEPEPELAEEPEVHEPAPAETGRLSGLFEKLSHDEELYAPLPPSEEEAGEDVAPVEPEPEPEPASPALVRVVARRFTPLVSEGAQADELPADEAAPNESLAAAEIEQASGEDLAPPEEPVVPPQAEEPVADPEAVERVSRYNFDELSRILNDRVSGELGPQSRRTTIEEIIEGDGAAAPAASSPTPAASGSLVNLGGETLVLNRLPLGILVFRDQQVLFANRAITEMIGYDSVESLRNAGLASIFPAASDEQPESGPVNHLVQRDGTLVPVTARLQSISWQGRPALMLSASATEVRTGHEGAVRAFAEMLAETREDGFVEANRAGVISGATPHALVALQRGTEQLVGRPLTAIIDRQDHPALQAFLERPARFAETARPVLVARGIEPGVEVMLFAQGQAGIVTGYFGFVRRREGASTLPTPKGGDSDPALLGRLSRGLRRPLNTIIGFSDLIGSAAFGEIGNPRYREYALDIKTAGQEITALVDELDDFTRLRDGRYAPRPSDVDLGALLESCVIRVRGQANGARVLVRSAISERLPRIRADRASLGQAVLNLLASAIDQTPVGGAVVLSSQLEDDGSISVHVRDSANRHVDQSERFVVFRDGVSKDGETLTPIRSTVGLALTRSLLAVNACSLSVDPAGSVGTIFSLLIPRELVTRDALPAPADEADPAP
ncbi:HAMP domain-containing histidine kinase [Youhaiella tibetensis]|uniref:histidine kinase n=1 Tax=Paradevosia tibetensis TaxID=1447062 RepID=A0A5B9DK46_9HYPH|nr:HAMP domain-containing sensor histidine kinase [Youhaiella tibetensis]QEE19503.1 HAMP domain-containing histidine kinase [Youhaiella tibetensis]